MKLNGKLVLPIGLGLLILISAIFMFTQNQSKNDEDFLIKHGLKNQSIQEMAATLEQSTDEASGFYAAITGENLILGDETNEFKYKIANDAFYLSFAPYIHSTHPCGNHNLVTCRGEMQNVTVHVLVKDVLGNIIINDDYTSYANGFVGLWLPKNIDGQITVSYQGLSATSDIQTTKTSNTCLTTLKLS